MLKYNETAQTLQSARQKFLNAAAKVINGASSLTTDLDKEQYVYKALQNMCVYDENSDMNQSAYSVFINGSSVCADIRGHFSILCSS